MGLSPVAILLQICTQLVATGKVHCQLHFRTIKLHTGCTNKLKWRVLINIPKDGITWGSWIKAVVRFCSKYSGMFCLMTSSDNSRPMYSANPGYMTCNGPAVAVASGVLVGPRRLVCAWKICEINLFSHFVMHFNFDVFEKNGRK